MPAKPDSPSNLTSLGLAMTAQAPLPMAVIEVGSHILRYANPAFCRLLDQPLQALLGKSFCALLPDQPQCRGLLEQVARSGSGLRHDQQLRSGPHPMFWSFLMWPLLDDGLPAAVIVQITESVQQPATTPAMNEATLGARGQEAVIDAAEEANRRVHEEIMVRKRTELALTESELRYQALFDSVPVGVFVCDLDGIVQSYNRRAAELWLRQPTPGDANVRYCGSMRLYLPDGSYLPHEQSPMVEVMRTGVAANNITVFSERPDGTRIPVIVNFSALRNEYGDITGAITSFDDISELYRAETLIQESESRFRAIADHIPQLAWMVDAEGYVDWFNRGWLEYTGTTLEDNLGEGWKAVHHPAHVVAVAAKFEKHLSEGIDWEDTFPLRGKDGEYRWFLSRMVAIRDANGKLLRFFGTNTDITRQREVEHTLKQADQRKTEFLALLAHELRNPLAPISNAVQILLQDTVSAEARQAAVRMMDHQLGQMVRLVDDLLDISRISQNKIELRKCQLALAPVVSQAVEAVRPAFAAKQLALTLSLPSEAITVDGDATRLAQVIDNLLTNAGKFTPNGGKVHLTVETRGQEVLIRVRDSGIGIAAEQLTRVFELFAQVDASLERGQSGLGIGLSLVKQLAEMHGGSVEVHSAGLGQGSEFIVRLPVLAAAAKRLPPPVVASAPEPVAELCRRRILVVDDNLASAQSLSMLLQLHGQTVQMAHDGIEALALAESFRPEVILLDIGLPRLNGYEVASQLRQQVWGKAIMLIAVTGWGQAADKQRAEEAGFDHHMVKPLRHNELMTILAGLPVTA